MNYGFERNGIVRANQLNEPINKHFQTLKTKFTDQWNEISLIENQMGKTFQENMTCAYHRYTLGICWSQPKICLHPLHQLGKKGSVTHTAPEETWKVICSQHSDSYFPFGSHLCYQHLKIHETASVPGEHAAGVSDDDYELEEMYIKHDKLESSRCIDENIAECFETSPVIQLKRKRARDVSESTKKYYRKKFRTITCSLLDKFAEGAAPGQEKDFMSKVLGINMSPSSDSEGDTEIPEDLRKYLEKYQYSDREVQVMILSLTDFSKYSHKFLLEVFCCSKYKIDKAKMLANKSKGLTLPWKGSFKRNKLNATKVEHFFNFIFDSGLLQDVVYGINKLKYNSGNI